MYAVVLTLLTTITTLKNDSHQGDQQRQQPGYQDADLDYIFKKELYSGFPSDVLRWLYLNPL